MTVEQPRRAEDHAAKVADLTPVLLHRGDIVVNVAGDIIGRIGVFRTLAVDVRLDRLDRLDRGGVRNEHDVIDTGKCGERAGAERIIEIRTAGALVDESVWGNRDDQDVALRLGLGEVADVAGVEKVEDPVALDNGLLLPSNFC